MRLTAMTRAAAALIVGLLLTVSASAQTALTTTTLTTAVTSTTVPGSVQLTVASNTGMTANTTAIYMNGEFMPITAVSGTTLATVTRGGGSTPARTHPANSYIWVGTIAGGQSAFTTVDPGGSCTAAGTYSPTINISNGRLWACSNSMWQALGLPNVANLRPRVSITGLTVSGGGSLPYPILPTDDIVALSTTSAGCLCVAGSSSVNKSFVLPSHLGLAGKQITIVDESGGISATTSIVLVGTINGTNSSSVNVVQLKTPFSSVVLHAGSGGWFVDSCFTPQATGVVVSGQCR